MNKPQLIVAWVAGILLSGCATVGSINRNVKRVNYADGINEKEARWIAQKYCLDKRIKDARISSTQVSNWLTEPDKWIVIVPSKNWETIDCSYMIDIDKKTGEVTYCGFGK